MSESRRWGRVRRIGCGRGCMDGCGGTPHAFLSPSQQAEGVPNAGEAGERGSAPWPAAARPPPPLHHPHHVLCGGFAGACVRAPLLAHPAPWAQRLQPVHARRRNPPVPAALPHLNSLSSFCWPLSCFLARLAGSASRRSPPPHCAFKPFKPRRLRLWTIWCARSVYGVKKKLKLGPPQAQGFKESKEQGGQAPAGTLRWRDSRRRRCS